MKRIVKFLTMILVFTFIFTACSTQPASESSSSDEPQAEAPETEEQEAASAEEEKPEPNKSITLRALVRPDEGGNIGKYSAMFEEETGIKVEVDFVGWSEIYNKIVTTIAAGGGGYDIVFIPSANALEFSPSFEPIGDLIVGEEDLWLSPVVDLYSNENGLFAMPWYSGGAHMSYNKEIFEAAGISADDITSWNNFMTACQKIKETNAADFCFSPSAKYAGNFYYNWGSMVLANGGELFDVDGNPVFQEGDAALNAFEMLQTGISEGYFDPAGVALDDYETLIEFGSGTTAMLLNSTWSSTQANVNTELSQVTGKVGYMLIPGNGEIRSAGFLYAGGLGILQTSEHKEEAKQLLKYWTSEEAQKHHAIEGANLPTRVSLFTNSEISEKWNGYTELASQLEYGQFPPQFTWFEEWRRQAASATQDVMNNEKTPQEAIDWLVEETNRLKNQ